MPFFSQFPKRDVQIEFTKVDSNGSIVTERQDKKLVDIFRHVDVSSINAQEYTAYQYYQIQDGDRPDIISHKLYNTPDYYWTFFIVNDFLQAGFNEFFKSDYDLNRGVELEYEGLGALIFLPDSRARQEGEENLYEERYLINSVAGLPLEDRSFVKLVNIANNATATVEKYDAEKLLVIVDNVSSSSFFADNDQLENVDLDASIAPPDREVRKIGQFRIDISAGTTVEKEAWLQEFNEATAAQGYKTIWTEASLPIFLLQSFTGYTELANAPYSYKRNSTVDGEGERDERIYAFQALGRSAGSITNVVTHREQENNENEEKRQIVVVKPEYIDRFAEQYRNLVKS